MSFFAPHPTFATEVFTRLRDGLRRPRRSAGADASRTGRETDAFLEGPSFHRDERSRYEAAGLLFGALALVTCSFSKSSALFSILSFCAAVVGMMSYQSTFWPIPSSLLTGRAAAGGLALIVSMGNLGGFAESYLISEIKQATGSFSWALTAVAACLLLGAVLIRIVRTECLSRALSPSGRRLGRLN